MGGFVLCQWASNDVSALSNVPKNLWETSTELELDQSLSVKTLGLLWFPEEDSFKFKVPPLPELGVVTKRIVVSEMSQLFDPLGLLGPVVVNAKMFIKHSGPKACHGTPNCRKNTLRGGKNTVPTLPRYDHWKCLGECYRTPAETTFCTASAMRPRKDTGAVYTSSPQMNVGSCVPSF